MTSTKIRLLLTSLLCVLSIHSNAMVWWDGDGAVTYSLPQAPDSVLSIAAGMFSSDMEAVTGKKAILTDARQATIRLLQLDTASEAELREAKEAGIDVQALQKLTDGFAISEKDGAIHIAGNNSMGTAYGLLELSRKAGVSPWIWWGDVMPQKKERLEIEDGFRCMQGASVKQRGINIKDAEWSLLPWSRLNSGPSQQAGTAPLAYRKVFELMLRLRGNTLLQNATPNFTDTATRCRLSYRGEPHDYLWLTTTQPGLIWKQMHDAYDSGNRELWIADIHDPKIAGYDLELFMDIAWDINSVDASNIRSHYKAWLNREFGSEATELIFPAMHDFYRLCGQRKPEFMGWSQVGKDPAIFEHGMTPVRSTELNPEEFGDELERYIEEFDRAAYVVDYATKLVDPSLYDAYYSAIIYPVCASAAHTRSILNAQKARALSSRRGSTADILALEDSIRKACAESQRAYQEVRKLTEYYNDVVSDGKWKGIMDMRPGDLPVFSAPSLPMILTEAEMAKYPSPYAGNPRKARPGVCVAANADSYARLKGEAIGIGMLGHSMNAVALAKGSAIGYDFEVAEKGDGVVRIALLPKPSSSTSTSRFSVSVDGGKPALFSLDDPYESEQWKEDALRGQTIVEVPVTLKAGKHTLEIKALDNGIIIDQWMWDPDPDRRFYLFPV